MRFVIGLLILAAFLMCLFAQAAAVRGLETTAFSTGISDPAELSTRVAELLPRHFYGSALATVALLLMAVDAFVCRSIARGVAITLFGLITAVVAVVAVRDWFGVANAYGTYVRSPVPESAPSPEQFVPPHRATIFGPMSREIGTPQAITNIFATGDLRMTTTLCLLGLGASLSLMGSRKIRATVSESHPPPIPPAS